ncbi:hypothetical protein GGR58DRAFT_504071 [Xylaria digitata]|nr:hypothetical protein GGR58DRAFT_504071 [Xylaria digitata]
MMSGVVHGEPDGSKDLEPDNSLRSNSLQIQDRSWRPILSDRHSTFYLLQRQRLLPTRRELIEFERVLMDAENDYCRRELQESLTKFFKSIETLLLRYEPTRESVESRRASNWTAGSSPASLDTLNNPANSVMDFELSTASESPLTPNQSEHWDQVTSRTASFSRRLSRCQGQFGSIELPAIPRGGDYMFGVEAEIISSLILLAKNVQECMFALIPSRHKDMFGVYLAFCLLTKGGVEQLRLVKPTEPEAEMIPTEERKHVSPSDTLNAIEGCIHKLEKSLQMALDEKSLREDSQSSGQSPSVQKHELSPSLIAIDHTLKPHELADKLVPPENTTRPFKALAVSLSMNNKLTTSSRESLGKPVSRCYQLLCMHLTNKYHLSGHKGVHSEQLLESNLCSLRESSPNLNSETDKTTLVARSREDFIKELERLLKGLHTGWEKVRPDQTVCGLTTGVLQSVTISISTDPAKLDPRTLVESKLDDDDASKPASPADHTVDIISEGISGVRLVDDNFLNNVAEELIARISNEFRPELYNRQTFNFLPGFSDTYIVMESCVNLLESLLDCRIDAESKYLDHARSLLPIIQYYLLSRLLEVLFKLPAQLRNTDTPRALEGITIPYTVTALHSFILRLIGQLNISQIDRVLGTEWDRLRYFLCQLQCSLHTFRESLSTKLANAVGTKDEDRMDQADDEGGRGNGSSDVFAIFIRDISIPFIGGIFSVPPASLIFHFTDDMEKRAKQSMPSLESFVAEHVNTTEPTMELES